MSPNNFSTLFLANYTNLFPLLGWFSPVNLPGFTLNLQPNKLKQLFKYHD